MIGIYEVPEGGSLEPSAIVTACIETRARAVLADAEALPSDFFDLSSGVAGELAHRLGMYGVRLAAVVSDPSVHSAAFQDFVAETNRGNRVRFFPTRQEALDWLGA